MVSFIACIGGSAPGEGSSKASASACRPEDNLGVQCLHWPLPPDWYLAPDQPPEVWNPVCFVARP